MIEFEEDYLVSQDLYLIGFRDNVISGIFLANIDRSAIGLRGIIYVGRSENFLKISARLLLRGRFRAFYSCLMARISPRTTVIDVCNSDDAELEKILRERSGSLFVVCGCDRILRKDHLSHGVFVNYHNSILPAARGVAAIKWSKYNDLPVGFTFHTMEPEIDTGVVLLQEVVSNRTAKKDFILLSDILTYKAARALSDIPAILLGKTAPRRFDGKLRESYNSKRDTAIVCRVSEGNANPNEIRKIVRAF